MSRVSVVIPCHNYARFLGDAIESVLGQTHHEIELIVVDYGSTDSTSDVVARYHARYVGQENLGVAVARNTGLEASSGSFVVFLDADDQLLPDAIASSLTCLEAQPESAFVYGHQRWVDASGPVAPKRPQQCVEEDPYSHMLRMNNPIRAPGAILYQRDLVDQVGGFVRKFEGCEDLDLNFRLVRDHPICCNDRVVLLTRIHETNVTRRWRQMLPRAVAVQRSQRPYVVRNQIYESDYRTGLRLARSYWGGHLANEIVAEAAAGRARDVLRDFGTLVRYYPRGAASLPKLIGRRVVPWLRGRRFQREP